MPIDKIVERDRLVGLIFQQTKVENGRVVPIPDSERTVRSTYVISSIGSVPDHIPGIPTRGQTYDVEDEVYCRIAGYTRVFALGNTVTGRGNIKESMAHGRAISKNVIEGYLGHASGEPDEEVTNRISSAVTAITDEIRNCQMSPASMKAIQAQVDKHHNRAGYAGDYREWVHKHMPDRLEHLLGVKH